MTGLLIAIEFTSYVADDISFRCRNGESFTTRICLTLSKIFLSAPSSTVVTPEDMGNVKQIEADCWLNAAIVESVAHYLGVD